MKELFISVSDILIFSLGLVMEQCLKFLSDVFINRLHSCLNLVLFKMSALIRIKLHDCDPDVDFY